MLPTVSLPALTVTVRVVPAPPMVTVPVPKSMSCVPSAAPANVKSSFQN